LDVFGSEWKWIFLFLAAIYISFKNISSLSDKAACLATDFFTLKYFSAASARLDLAWTSFSEHDLRHFFVDNLLFRTF
jgi:hypothetical protein